MLQVQLLTEREYQHWASFDVCYDWEDIISKILRCPMQSMWKGNLGQIKRYSKKVSWKIRRKIGAQDVFFRVDNKNIWNLFWIMNAGIYQEYTFKNSIPLFLDFPVYMVNSIAKATKNLPVFWVTCHDIYRELRHAGCENVKYFPLSVSDIYVPDEVPQKTIDVIQMGRRNERLHEFMLDYCGRYPDIEYVYAAPHRKNNLGYISTIRGYIGEIATREKYMEVLADAKVAIVSTPGAEKSSRFGNIDFITPRFYECAAKYCFMIGKYTNNREIEITGLNKICPNIDNQKEFDRYITEYLSLNAELNKARYKEFLGNNVTSKRAEELKEELYNL